MACHCAAHMLADGDLQGGLRNLWDFHCLAGDFVAADAGFWGRLDARAAKRSEEHTSELQSLMRISYAVFCLKKKTHNIYSNEQHTPTLQPKQHTTAHI